MPLRRYAWESPGADRVVEDALHGIAEDVARLGVPALWGVVLGGGYGRGEGGVRLPDTPPDAPPSLSNDLDFFAVVARGAGETAAAAAAQALAPAGEKWSARLGVDVEFTAKTPERLKKDEARLMVQELLRGHCGVWGAEGRDLFSGLDMRPADALPWTEAVRLLVNRGAGLLLAREPGRSADFTARNIAKAVLGAGDARLVARGAYRWRAAERRDALGEAPYARALQWKFRPVAAPPCPWEEARAIWLDAVGEVRAAGTAGGRRRSLREAARWVARRGTLGNPGTLGWEPVARILENLEKAVRAGSGFPPELRRDWEVFN